jgi:hypothetical protein
MIDYALILSTNYPAEQWAIDGNDYNTLQWLSDSNKPTQAELDAQWPQVNYASQCAQVETARRIAYETESDGLFFEWQRGDGTEAAWRAAVAKVKAANPYPAQPKTK